MKLGNVHRQHMIFLSLLTPGPDLVTLLLTLASPHQRPPWPLHASLVRFYRDLKVLPAPRVPIVSLAGGFNDTLMATELTLLQGGHNPFVFQFVIF